MTDFHTILAEARRRAFSEKDKGTRFERLMQAFLQTYPPYLGRFTDVWMWSDFPYRKDFGGKDTGIDLVARTTDGDYWAVQCKCYQAASQITKKDVDTFLATSSRTFRDGAGRTTRFAQRLWLSTTDKWNKEAENTIRHQDPPVARIGLGELEDAPVDWEKLAAGITGAAAARRARTPKPHQMEAMDAARAHYAAHDRGKLIMACGTGKTYTALKIAEQEAGAHGLVLFLVPSIALLGQTLREWSTYAQGALDAICVCSDASASKSTDDALESVDLALPATTDAHLVATRLRQARLRTQPLPPPLGDKQTHDALASMRSLMPSWLVAPQGAERVTSSEECGLTVVFSTYQSIDVIHKAQAHLLATATPEEKAADTYVFDLIVCDEAHRTTGVEEKDQERSPFTKVHDNTFIEGKKRLYMTATPRLYSDDAKKKAAEKDVFLCTMDDPAIYGEEFFRINFSRAVAEGLLCDYKVLVLTIGDDQIPPALQAAIADPDQEIQTDDASKLIGCINALSKRMITESRDLTDVDPQPMHTALAFCPRIKASKQTAKIFNGYKDLYYDALPPEERASVVTVSADHVDGTMGAARRDEKLRWLKNADGTAAENECRILTNVRCLSEGVDVPALDAVLFLSARKSQVDIVQSVGRVMRTAPGKRYGYIIIPVIIPADASPEDALEDNKTFGVVWSVLNALRAHDDRFHATINKIDLQKNKADNPNILVAHDKDPRYNADGTEKSGNAGAGGSYEQTTLYFHELQGAIYARMVQKVGSRLYWEQWAKDVARIAARHKERITQLVATDDAHRAAFQSFMDGLHRNINPYITEDDAIEMLAQHIITRPVFEALFANDSFSEHNSVSCAMQKILALLDDDGFEKDLQGLQKFYDSVRMRCEGIKDAEGRQRVIIQLYNNFFQTALPKTVGKLGIVYTPVEVVDFILHSVDDVLKKEFRSGLTKPNVHILDPFTGTGTFLTRLLQSGILRPGDLWRKYAQELHANEIVLLAYYIASINIENAFHDLVGGEDYTGFDGICLTDTFQLGENRDADNYFTRVFPRNSTRVMDQQATAIRVIIGNPPYSVGQKSANDNAQNEHYPHLEKRLADTYVAGTNATLKNALYDSYIKAFRWASDRLDDKNGGVIGFVSNAGWLDGIAMDGMRACLEKEFTSIYVFNLRGDQRTKGEQSRREGGKIFGSGSRAAIAITILVKNPAQEKERADIYYVDIGDYLSREQKLATITELGSCMSQKFTERLTVLHPNEKHDWIHQRNGMFDQLILMGDKKHKENAHTVFCPSYSNGVKTQRDAWCCNFSRQAVAKNMQATIAFFNAECERREKTIHAGKTYEQNMDATKISWSTNVTHRLEKNQPLTFHESHIILSIYRPFCRTYLYYDQHLNERRGQMPSLFPTTDAENLLICVPGVSAKCAFMPFMINEIPSLDMVEKGQFFPLYYYDQIDNAEATLFDAEKTHTVRRDGVTDFILAQARGLYGDRVTKEDIFYYVYAFLHLPAYRATFAADLKKSLPRIQLVETPKTFWQLAKAGRALADLHLHYDAQPAPAGVTVTENGSPLDTAALMDAKNQILVTKMRFGGDAKKKDRTTIRVNDAVTIEHIPLRAYDYQINGSSPVDWILDRYQLRIDKASQIPNDPNAWAREHDDPTYIVRLLLSAITVSLQTLDIVDGLPDVCFDAAE